MGQLLSTYLIYIVVLILGVLFVMNTKQNDGFQGGSLENVAIIFSGRIKGYQHVLPKLRAIQERYNPVIFCSLNDIAFTDDISAFCKALNIPKGQVSIEQTVLPKWSDRCNLMNPVLNTYSMFYHENKAFALMEDYMKTNLMQFDCVVYYRADMNSTDTLELVVPEKNTIYLPANRDYGGYNDRMAYGDYHSMKVYCGLINSFKSLCNDPKRGPINAEGMLSKYLTEKQIRISPIEYNTDLHISRNNKFESGIFDQ